MYFVLIEATPRPGARTPPDVVGAYVGCWIERPTIDEAIGVARSTIEAEGWMVNDLCEAYAVDATRYPPGADGREYFEQALVDKEVYVFYSFPEMDEEAGGEILQ